MATNQKKQVETSREMYLRNAQSAQDAGLGILAATLRQLASEQR